MYNRNILSETSDLFAIAAEKLDLPNDLRAVLDNPYREIRVELPVRDIDGQFHLFRGYRIQHNGARGPYYGGLIFDPNLSAFTLIALAKKNTWKTAMMDLPFGGAFGGVNCDGSKLSLKAVEQVMRGYTGKISALIGPYRDIMTQGKNTDARLMAYIMDEYGKKAGYSPAVVTGKPEALSGTIARANALVSSTYYLLDILARNMQIQLNQQSIAMSMPLNTALTFIEYLNVLGCRLISLTDGNCVLYNQNGLDLQDLKFYIINNNRLEGYPAAESIHINEFLALQTDILVLGVDTLDINSENVSGVKARIICEITDAVISMDAESQLSARGVAVLPDLMCTSGEAIVDYFEWIQNIQQFRWDYDLINEEMAKYVNQAFKQIVGYTTEYNVSFRLAAYMLGIKRVAEATKLRGYI